jgi:hypothetical protein
LAHFEKQVFSPSFATRLGGSSEKPGAKRKMISPVVGDHVGLDNPNSGNIIPGVIELDKVS